MWQMITMGNAIVPDEVQNSRAHHNLQAREMRMFGASTSWRSRSLRTPSSSENSAKLPAGYDLQGLANLIAMDIR
jgi:hypothetical protein